MQRIQAVVALLAILATPLALIARGEACADSCAKYCCPISSQHARAASAANMKCHQRNSSGSEKCCSAPASNHVLDYGFATPLPQTVLTITSSIEAPQFLRRSIAFEIPLEFSNSIPPPFEPPRS